MIVCFTWKERDLKAKDPYATYIGSTTTLYSHIICVYIYIRLGGMIQSTTKTWISLYNPPAHPHKWHSDPSPADFSMPIFLYHTWNCSTPNSDTWVQNIFQHFPSGIITNKKWTNDVVKISLIHEVNIGIFHSLLFGCPLSQDMFRMRCHPPPHLHSESGPCHQPTRFHQSGRLRKQNKQTRWTTTTNNQTSRRSGFCWGQKLAKKNKYPLVI